MKTIEEAAKELSVSIPTIRNWIRNGKINVMQMTKGGLIRITDEEIERLKKGE